MTIRGDLENGFYHGVQVDVRDEEPERRIQRQALFAPQNAAYIFGVEASIPEAIDVSALTTSSIDFSEYVVFDDTVLVELRVLQEESGENNPNSFKRTSNTAYSFGPFDSLDPVSLELTFFDGAGNATTYYTKLQPEVPYVGVHDVSLDE